MLSSPSVNKKLFHHGIKVKIMLVVPRKMTLEPDIFFAIFCSSEIEDGYKIMLLFLIVDIKLVHYHTKAEIMLVIPHNITLELDILFP